jgi:hypothetical protein
MCPADTLRGGRWRFLAVWSAKTLRIFARSLGFKSPLSHSQLRGARLVTWLASFGRTSGMWRVLPGIDGSSGRPRIEKTCRGRAAWLRSPRPDLTDVGVAEPGRADAGQVRAHRCWARPGGSLLLFSSGQRPGDFCRSPAMASPSTGPARIAGTSETPAQFPHSAGCSMARHRGQLRDLPSAPGPIRTGDLQVRSLMAGGAGDGLLWCQSSGVRFSPTDLAPHAEVKSRSIARSRGEQDGRQAGRRSRRQHRHRTVGCPVPIGSRLFPLDRTKREQHNSLNLNGSEGCVSSCSHCSRCVSRDPYSPRPSPDRCDSCSSRAAAVPRGTVHARICPVLPGQRRDFLGFFAAPEGFKSPSSHFGLGQVLAAGTVPAFLGQIGFLRVVLGSYRDSDFASFRSEVCGVARVSGSVRSWSSRSSNLPPLRS